MNSNNLAKERIGKTNENNYGSIMKVVNYINSHDIVVEFIEFGNLVKATWQQFNDGEIKNPFDRSIFGVGYLGTGKYMAYINRIATPQYASWKHMLERCYDDKLHKKFSTYKNCKVVEEWHNFQNFAAWYDQNYYNVEGERMHLDKDILHKGNKIYSPETCVFVPNSINTLFTKRDSARGDTPIGVTYVKRDNIYAARCMNGKGKGRKSLGSHSTPEEAFYAYKSYKEQLIKHIAEEYKEFIPHKLYQAMITYKVEITD
jgi:hypothetical protein